MAVARVDSETMVNFNHISVRTAVTGENDGAGGRGGDTCAPGAGKIDAGHMRVVAYQPADPLQDHPVLVIERRIFDRDRYLSSRQPILIDRFDSRDNLASLLVQYQRAFQLSARYVSAVNDMLDQLYKLF